MDALKEFVAGLEAYRPSGDVVLADGASWRVYLRPGWCSAQGWYADKPRDVFTQRGRLVEQVAHAQTKHPDNVYGAAPGMAVQQDPAIIAEANAEARDSIIVGGACGGPTVNAAVTRAVETAE